MVYSRFLRIAVISCLVAPGRVAAQTCELTDLGPLGQSWSRAQGMNAAGMVVGGSPPARDMSPGPFVWRDGRMRALPTPDGHGTATGIDSTGKRIVGELPGARAALWTDGVLMPLPTNEGFTSSAASVNDAGLIVGAMGVALPSWRATLWKHGQATALGTLGGMSSRAWAVNQRGDIVGQSRTAEDRMRPFLYRDGQMRELPLLSGFTEGGAAAISDTGFIAGVLERVEVATRDANTGETYAPGDARAVVWAPDGRLTVLPTLGGRISRAAGRNAVNDRGEVVGESATAAGAMHAFLWKAGKMLDLNSLLPAGIAVVVTTAAAINNNGQVGARALIAGVEHAVLLVCK
jgi:probable HAF family extracellular repeat protein